MATGHRSVILIRPIFSFNELVGEDTSVKLFQGERDVYLQRCDPQYSDPGAVPCAQRQRHHEVLHRLHVHDHQHHHDAVPHLRS